MQSQITTFFSTTKPNHNNNNSAAAADILETKAITEYERDRKRAHKGDDVKRKVVHTHTPNKNSRTPAWKRHAGSEEKERRVSSKLGREFLDDTSEDVDQWLEEPVGADQEDTATEKENRPHVNSVRLEDLVVKTAGKGGKKNSRPLTTRPSTPQLDAPPFVKPPTDLLLPLMDTIPRTPFNGVAEDYDDLCFEFSSPGFDDWTVTATADGCLRYSTFDSVEPATPATTVLVMPCIW